MNFTPGQLKDLEIVEYFIPDCLTCIKITDDDRRMFCEWSERGKYKELINERKMDGFNALIQGKRWRGIHMQMWEDGNLDGTMPYMELIKDMSKNLVDFIKKELFKGIDADLIENCYQHRNYWINYFKNYDNRDN
jgi:hypothetical protein